MVIYKIAILKSLSQIPDMNSRFSLLSPFHTQQRENGKVNFPTPAMQKECRLMWTLALWWNWLHAVRIPILYAKSLDWLSYYGNKMLHVKLRNAEMSHFFCKPFVAILLRTNSDGTFSKVRLSNSRHRIWGVVLAFSSALNRLYDIKGWTRSPRTINPSPKTTKYVNISFRNESH